MRPVHCVIPVIVAVCIGGSLSPAHALPAIDPAEPGPASLPPLIVAKLSVTLEVLVHAVISGEDMLNRFLGFGLCIDICAQMCIDRCIDMSIVRCRQSRVPLQLYRGVVCSENAQGER